MTRIQMCTTARPDLEYLMPLGVHDPYPQAHHVVDCRADQDFPVQNGALVGTEQRSIEPVTGHLTRGVIVAAGAVSVLWIALFVGIAFGLFRDRNQLGLLLTTPLLGAVLGLAWSRLGHSTATRGGTRKFTSVNDRHHHVRRARGARAPGSRA